MKRTSLLFLLVFAFSSALFAQLDSVFYRQGPLNAYGQGQLRGTVTDALDNVYVMAGYQWPDTVITITRYDSDGLFDWEARVRPSAGNTVIYSLSMEMSQGGDLILAGAERVAAGGNSRSFVAKYDTSGNLLWRTPQNYVGYLTPYSLVENPDGSLAICGISDSIPTYGEIRIWKLDGAGTNLWQKIYVSNLAGYGLYNSHLNSDRNGGYYLSFTQIGSINPFISAVARLDSVGDTLWSQDFADRIFREIAVDTAGNIHYAGENVSNSNGMAYGIPLAGGSVWTDTMDLAVRKGMAGDNGEVYWTGFSSANQGRVIRYSGNGNRDWDYSIATVTGGSGMQLGKLPGGDIVVSGINSLIVGGSGLFWNSATVADFHRFDAGTGALKGVENISLFNGAPGSVSIVNSSGAVSPSGSIYFVINTQNSTSRMALLKICSDSTCGGNVGGEIYFDQNGNCQRDAGENPRQYALVQATPGSNYAFTDATGGYLMDLNPGSYSVNHTYPTYWQNSCFTGGYAISTGSGQVHDTLDFPYDPVGTVRDLNVDVSCGFPRVGANIPLYINFGNQGTAAENGTICLELDSAYQFVSATPIPDSIAGNTICWDYTGLAVFENRTISLTITTNSSATAGHPVTNCVSISPASGDETPFNNSSCCTDTLRGSYDPNDKNCFPAPGVYSGNTDSVFHYTIRFQNTGNDTAFSVTIRDTLDAGFDIGTFRMGTASHAFELTFDPPRTLVWTFPNIILPDSGTNEPASKGQLSFSIQGDLPTAGQFENNASIYFDLNPPIKTNTVRHSFLVSAWEETKPVEELLVFPQPATNSVTVRGAASWGRLQKAVLVDLAGRAMEIQQGENSGSEARLEFQGSYHGIYLLRCYFQEKSTAKLIQFR